MLRSRLPWRFQSLQNFLNEHTNFVFGAVLNTPPIRCNPEAAVEYISLVCHRDVNIYILATKSFLRFYSNVAVVVHSDGTLTRGDIINLRGQIPGIHIISRQEADERVAAKLSSESLKRARASDVSFIKLIDVNLFSKRRRIIADSDLLFLQSPSEVIQWIETRGERGFYHAMRGGNKRFAGHLAALNAKLDTKIKTLDYCSGFIGYSARLCYKDLERALGVLTEIAEGWGLEQVIHAFILSDSSEKLPPEKYAAGLAVLSRGDVIPATMVHFVGKLKHWQYFRCGNAVIRDLRRY